MEKQLFGR
jgi:hypothetical protein